jgi:pregnancy-associated plasma protein-A
MKYSIQILFLFTILLLSCNKKIKKEYLSTISLLPSSFERDNNGCKDQLNYIPDLDHLDHSPIKYLRINFHIMCNAKGEGNFNSENGRVFINEVMKSANEKLSRNAKMNLPPGNETPVVPMRYRYVLTGLPGQPEDDGIYFHNDEELYAMIGTGKRANNYDKTVFEKYGIQKDTVLNIFIMTHHVDSVASETYVTNSKGIGFSNFLKVTHWFQSVRDTTITNGKSSTSAQKWNAVKLLHHEIGHTMGLAHTWKGNDGCDDTPNHSNCWNRTKGKAPCDEWWSNNFMDYNAHNSAWSPCQIGILHRNFSDQRKPIRKLLEPNWCQLDDTKTITIKEKIDWLGAKDLEGNLIIEAGGILTIRCRVSLPKDAKIIIHPKGKLILDGGKIENDCGDTWKGIEIWSKKDSKGEVELFNNSSILNAENEIRVSEEKS